MSLFQVKRLQTDSILYSLNIRNPGGCIWNYGS